jgi:hypothetical protein
MRYAFLSVAALAALALSAGSASAQWGYRYGGYYGPGVYPGPRYVAPGYGGFYNPGFYGRSGVTVAYSPAFGLSIGYRSGPSWGYPGFGYPAYRYGYRAPYSRYGYGYPRYWR